MEESALRPKWLGIGIYGSGNYDGNTIPFPSTYINDALSQNILYYCYEDAHTVEELSKLCGVPAYYIEDRIKNLMERDALLEPVKGKYRTDFIIYSDKHGIYCEENAEKALMPMMDKLLTALDNIAAEANQLNFYRGGKSENDLYYLYGALAFNHLSECYSTLPCPSIPERYDGHHWRYIGFSETGQHRRIRISINSSGDEKTGYSSVSFGGFAQYSLLEMISNNYINACKDILATGTCTDASSVAYAIQKGFIIKKDNGEFFVTIPVLDAASKASFSKLVEKHLVPLAEEYSKLTAKFITGYKKLFPKHLNDDADRMCHSMMFGLYAVVVEYAQRIGRIAPTTEGSRCEVLIQN